MYYRTQAKIDLDAIEYNYNSIRKKIPSDCKLLGVIKAYAYGHGSVRIARLLDGKCDFFGVATVDEAVELKNAGILTPILILGRVMPCLYDDVVKYGLRIPIFTLEDAEALSKEAVRQGKTVAFHFCVDTGMSRIGFQVSDETADLCKKICELPNIEAEGLFSHFAKADEADLTGALTQRSLFKSFIAKLEDRGINIPIKHINNSAGIINFDQAFDMCRMGIILYGLYPSDEVDKAVIDLKPALKWVSHICYIKTLDEGREISYGGTYKTSEKRVIATVPVGYADGYPRLLSNKGRVIVNGQYAKIVGRVCMDQFMIDVTGIENVDINTPVTLIGSDGEACVSMEEIAKLTGTINYEVTCDISRRVPRTYYKNGEFVGTWEHYYQS